MLKVILIKHTLVMTAKEADEQDKTGDRIGSSRKNPGRLFSDCGLSHCPRGLQVS